MKDNVNIDIDPGLIALQAQQPPALQVTVPTPGGTGGVPTSIDSLGTILNIGAINNGDSLVRSGTDIIGAAAPPPGLHASAHQNGGADEITVAGLSGVLADPQPPIIGAGAAQAVAGNDARLTDARTPTAHVASHANGGADELSVAGLSGVLADPQPPIIGSGAAQAVAGNDARLTDARTPTAHATSHVTGGSDVIANVVAAGNAGLMTGSDKTKLDGVAAGAEVNVNADWTSGAGDSQILNKPATFAPSAHTHPLADITDEGALASKNTVATGDIDNDAVTYAKMQNVSATDKLLGRSTAGAGDVEEIALTAAGRALIDDADNTAQRTTLGLGTLATQSGTFSGTSSGTNTGDQTSIVGITGTTAQFNTALSDGDFATGGGTATGTNTGDQVVPTTENIEDIVGAMVSGNTETGIAVTYDDTGAKLNFDAQTAGDARYAPIAKGVTNGDSHDHNGGDGAAIVEAAITLADNVTNNSSLTQHGFLPKLPGGTTTFLRADGAFAAPTAAASISQTEIDFGATPVDEASFLITDAAVSPTSKIIGSLAYVAPTGKDLDELDMDAIDLKFGPGTGQFTIYAKGLEGYLADKFKINYQVGA